MTRTMTDARGARITRRLRGVAVAAAALTALLAGAAGASAAGWLHHQTDADWCYDAVTIDSDDNGNFNQMWADLDNDCRWDTRLYNARGRDTLLEIASYDMDESGVPEFRLLDGDQRVGFDFIQADWNQDRRWDVRRIIPGSNADYRNRINRHNASRDLMFLFRAQTGQSLLYPTFTSPG